MRLLLTNDDGIYAPGISALAAALQEDGHQVWIVAPRDERSTCGHSMTLHRPIEVTQIAAQAWAVNGFPADCVLWAANYLLRQKKIDALIAGINQGGNMAQDLYYSGTASAAREGMQLGIPSIAVSLDVSFAKLFKDADKKEKIKIKGKIKVKEKEEKEKEKERNAGQVRITAKKTPAKFYARSVAKSDNFAAVATWMAKFLRHKLVAQEFKHCFLNLNFPDCPLEQYQGIKVVRPGYIDYDKKITPCPPFRQRHFYWIGGDTCNPILTPQTDVWAVKNKYIAASWVKLAAPLAENDLTDSPTAKVWQAMFSSGITRK